jgi:hypothetical protein
MALSKGTNSYATVAEADSYFEDRLDVAAWTSASAEQKAQALTTATAYLDSLEWLGSVVSSSQALAFPRTGSYFDPRLGLNVTLTSSIPERVVKATFELAYHLLNNDGLFDDTGSVVNLQIASIHLGKIQATNKISGTVRRLIQPLLLNKGSRTWWRAN